MKSKYLTSLLRHSALQKGLDMDENGFVSLDELITKCDYTLEEIENIVKEDDKQRFEIKAALVRAVQGHSIPLVKPLLERVTAQDIPVLVHGTFNEVLPIIRKEGLKRMNRTHIHFTTDKSGARVNANVFIYIDVPKAMAAGIIFEKSKNNVILSEGIDGVIAPDFFLEIVKEDCADFKFRF